MKFKFEIEGPKYHQGEDKFSAVLTEKRTGLSIIAYGKTVKSCITNLGSLLQNHGIEKGFYK